MKKIEQIILHESPHSDELLSFILLRQFGEKMFPGVTTARVTPFSAGLLKEGDLPENIIALGTGKGMFDEHGKSNYTCAAVLVAEKLGIDKNLSLVKILAQTLQEDRHGSSVKNEIPAIVKILHMAKFSLKEVLSWYETIFWAEFAKEENNPSIGELTPTTLESGYELVKAYAGEDKAGEWKALADLAIEKRQELFVKAKKHFQHHGKRQTLNTEDFGPLQIGFIELGNDDFAVVMNSAARFCKIEFFVQKNSEGNIQIFTDSKLKINLTNLARNIRVAEAKKRGVKIKSIQTIAMEGTHSEVPMWHLLEGACSMLFNGSLSATMIEPTALTPCELLEIIKETFIRKEKGFPVDPMAFKSSRATCELEGSFAK